ncbi:MAG: hypothetical protein DI586_06750 [Micavibrio aeruginosavorus]|uniref:SPOR domain-containing protein n=1 Tax=Micavibrio aeruginosavorus TaxID=349221 RepID=A0A2W5HIJ1_9BACT|nr:MAG: hypothetical protein DI586_06750 [Micavibrio aeruginosavorus]
MARRDEFDDEGFLDSLLNRKGNTELPAGLRRIFIVIGVLVLISIIIAVVSAAIPSKENEADMAPVPIIRADSAPYKIKPEDPGGMKVPNKDSTIFETLKGEQEENKVENLLEDESDTAASVARQEVVSKVISKSEPITDINDLKLDSEPAEEELSAPPQTFSEPVAQPVAQPVAKVETAKVETIKKEPKETASIIDTLKADSKPKELPVPKTETSKAAPMPSGGSTYIQLAAVKSEAEASSQWAKFKAKNPELGALSMRTQKADLGPKGIFYRIQAGPLSAANATKTCTAIKGRGGSCIIAK